MNARRNRIWRIGIVLASVGIACLLVMVGVNFIYHDSCANEVISETFSPDGSMKVVVFQRDCGATTGFSTQVSILPANRKLSNQGANVFVSDTDHGAAPAGPGGGPAVEVVWQNATSIVLSYHPRAR